MSEKKLTQAVFEGLSPKYRWAAVDADGRAYAFTYKPVLSDGYGLFQVADDAPADADHWDLGDGFDTTNWQNSLIERETDVIQSIADKLVGGWQESHEKSKEEQAQALAEAQAEIERLKSEPKAKDEALQAIIDTQAVEIAAGKAWVNILEATIDSLDAEIATLKAKLHHAEGERDQLRTHYKSKWISVESVILPPLHKEVLVFTRDKEFLVHARTQNMVAYADWATHWQHRPAPPEGV